jgi:hypothetical protein
MFIGISSHFSSSSVNISEAYAAFGNAALGAAYPELMPAGDSITN